ncbi:GGDEF domain-containing protein [Aliikangiella marina]|uniref:diguanylate cyclase n=1 Tax=Aliikangiella marina TaxID=1712262 RepID=A0A545TI18_9GAMM|nr:GGDEF domain-containing protein [Aliikangiella marina]TQV76880.1 GGDEF domain-containing protein [Aliikangiella marina]
MKANKGYKKLILCMSFFYIPFLVSSKQLELEAVDAQLQLAENVKSSDSVRFDELLYSINSKFDQLTIDQKYRYLFLSAYQSSYKGDVAKAIGLYKHVERNSQNVNLRYKASVSLVNLFSLRKDWQSGFDYLDTINNNFESIEDVSTRHLGLIGASFFYNELEQYEMTQIFVGRLIDEEVSGRNLCMTLGLKLRADLVTRKSELKESDFTSGIQSCLDVNEPIIANVMRSYFGAFYNYKKESETTIKLLERHYEESMGFNYPFLTFEINIALAKAYQNIGDLKKAKQFARVVADSPVANDYIERLVEAFEIIALHAMEKNEFEKAVYYQDKYIRAKEKLFEQAKAKQIAIEFSKHRAVEKDNQIKILNNQNRILQLEKELSEESALYNRWIIILLVVSVSILFMWVFYVKRSQQKLRYLAEFDSLTGVSNRAYFNQNSEAILNYYSKTNRTASLVLFDLDNFKKINDTYGHPIGDEVLKLAAEACKACVRKVDIFGRVGGEEFAMLLPGCELEQALKIAEDCRAKIESIDTSTLGMQGKITASFGVADSASTGYLLKDLTANADEAMYLAKRRGRNRVVNYQSSE